MKGSLHPAGYSAAAIVIVAAFIEPFRGVEPRGAGSDPSAGLLIVWPSSAAQGS
jgi:hypothetical protein